jgi:hypothetical protein
MATCARWFRGDEGEMNAWLRKQASGRQHERMVSAKLDARIGGGEKAEKALPREPRLGPPSQPGREIGHRSHDGSR